MNLERVCCYCAQPAPRLSRVALGGAGYWVCSRSTLESHRRKLQGYAGGSVRARAIRKAGAT